jgi:uracil-DNA glycosylase family 4
MCSLSTLRENTSFSKGQKPASVLIVFGAEPNTTKNQDELLEFIRQLNYELNHDWYYSFAIKCKQNKVKINPSQIECCNKWLMHEIKIVNPYLIIAMGGISTISLFGLKYYKLLKQNIFYLKDILGRTRQIFVGEHVNGDKNKIVANLNKLRTFIKEYYG